MHTHTFIHNIPTYIHTYIIRTYLHTAHTHTQRCGYGNASYHYHFAIVITLPKSTSPYTAANSRCTYRAYNPAACVRRLQHLHSKQAMTTTQAQLTAENNNCAQTRNMQHTHEQHPAQRTAQEACSDSGRAKSSAMYRREPIYKPNSRRLMGYLLAMHHRRTGPSMTSTLKTSMQNWLM